MKVVATVGRESVAVVYIVQFGDKRLVECVEALQPPTSRERKWVLLVSTMFGCPVGCKFCDAGGHYEGALSADEILEQIDFLVRRRFPDGRVPSTQFKIQFSRMGEPSMNPALLTVLEKLRGRYDAPGLLPSVSTVAPEGSAGFFQELGDIKGHLYPGGRFQFQFSVHTTDEDLRAKLIPVAKMGLEQMAECGRRLCAPGDRRIALNFALARGFPVDAEVLLRHFSPERFLIKITPLNPTHRAAANELSSCITKDCRGEAGPIVAGLEKAGYRVIVSIGEPEENLIGSNCGQYVRRHLEANRTLEGGYSYRVTSGCKG
ncbi:MAG: radical SAM protein [Candidatus Eisenbacteria bacterium]